MPGKTAAPHELPFVLQGDKPPSAEAATKPLAERTHKRLDEIAPKQIVGGSAGKLLIVDKTGATAFAAMKGDGTIDGEGNLQLGVGVVGATELATDSVTAAKIAEGAVGASEIAAGAVGASEIADGTVGSAELATSSKQLFPQLASAGTHKINFGTNWINASGTATASAAVNHGLGLTPVAVIATCESRDMNIATLGYGPAQFVMEMRDITQPFANVNTGQWVHWIAIG